VSVLLGAAVTCSLFAVLHPQGLPVVFGIVGIALAFTFMREWRDTLAPSIVARGINNGVVTVGLILLLTG